MKKFFKEFGKFINRGNVVDLAVGVIIGGAFSAIVSALTNYVLMPLINFVLLLITGGSGLDSIYTYLRKVTEENGVIDVTNSIYIDWGALITAVINFILIALVLFAIVKAINKINQLSKETKEANAALIAKKEEIKRIRKEEKVGKNEAEALYASRLAKAEEEAEEQKKQLAIAEAAAKEAEEKRIAALSSDELTNELLTKILAKLEK